MAQWRRHAAPCDGTRGSATPRREFPHASLWLHVVRVRACVRLWLRVRAPPPCPPPLRVWCTRIAVLVAAVVAFFLWDRKTSGEVYKSGAASSAAKDRVNPIHEVSGGVSGGAPAAKVAGGTTPAGAAAGKAPATFDHHDKL